MASSHDRAAWSHIFKMYKKMPHLWYRRNANYGNRSMMTEGYKILARIYKEKVDSDATLSDFRLKMKNLRTTYYRELRKVNAYKQKGEEYIPSLWYFEKLNFLSNSSATEYTTDIIESNSPVVSPDYSILDLNETQDEIDMEDLTHMIEDNSDTEDDPIPTTSYIKTVKRKGLVKKRKSNIYAEEDSDHIIMDTKRNKIMNDERWEVIGKSLGYQLRDLNTKQYTIVSKLISDAIYLGRLNKLTEASQINVGKAVYNSSTSSRAAYTISANKIYSSDLKVDDEQQCITFKDEEEFDGDD